MLTGNSKSTNIDKYNAFNAAPNLSPVKYKK